VNIRRRLIPPYRSLFLDRADKPKSAVIKPTGISTMSAWTLSKTVRLVFGFMRLSMGRDTPLDLGQAGSQRPTLIRQQGSRWPEMSSS